MTPLTVLAAALISVGWTFWSPRVVREQQDYLEPMADAFEALIKNSRSNLPADVYCLAMAPYGDIRSQWSDPSPALVTRLSAAHPSLRPSSQCARRQQELTGRFLEDSTGKQLMFITLSCSHRVLGDTLIFQGAYFCGGLCAAGGVVRVWRHEGRWQTRFSIDWVS